MARNWLICLAIFALLALSIDVANAQWPRSSRRPQRRSFQTQRSQSRRSPQTSETATPRVSRAMLASTAYKRGTETSRVRLDFVNTGDKWPQPNGLGTAITITYSYSNLLNGQMSGLTSAQLRQGVEQALGLWASVAPLNFVEVADSGPAPSDDFYEAGTTPQIRIGHHLLDGAAGPELAHAFIPFSSTDGTAGDLHFDTGEDWSLLQGGYFLETAVHELGHCLGLDHEEVEVAIMNPVLAGRFTGLDDGELFPDDVLGIQDIYGEGEGSVTPLPVDDPEGEPDDPNAEPLNGVAVETDETSGDVTIAGDDEDNTILLLSVYRLLIVVGLDGTPVNDQTVEWAYLPGGSTLDCAMAGGNDWVLAFRLRADEVTFDLGAGNDGLAIIFSWIGQLAAEGGDGTDRFLRFFAQVSSMTRTGFE